jgi:hypothetical protein
LFGMNLADSKSNTNRFVFAMGTAVLSPLKLEVNPYIQFIRILASWN